MKTLLYATDQGYDVCHGSGNCHEVPAELAPSKAIRQLLVNLRIGYWIGGGGYDYRLKAEDIGAVEVNLATGRWSANVKIHGNGPEDRMLRGSIHGRHANGHWGTLPADGV